MKSSKVTSEKKVTFELSPNSQVGIFRKPDGRRVCHAFVPIVTLKYASQKTGGLPEKVNPRPHGEDTKALVGKIPSSICGTLQSDPSTFVELNRGLTILVKKFELSGNSITINFGSKKDYDGNPSKYGVTDGMTTYAAIRDFYDSDDPNGHVHLEVMEGEKSLSEVANISVARNMVKPIKPVSMENYHGNYDSLKRVLKEAGVDDRISFDENTKGDINIADIISRINLFNPYYIEEGIFPLNSYLSRDTLTVMFRPSSKEADQRRTEMLIGILPLTRDILTLHDMVDRDFGRYCGFFPNQDGLHSSPWKAVKSRKRARPLIFIRDKAYHTFPKSLSCPMVASLRILMGNGIKWETDPFDVWNEFGSVLVKALVNRAEEKTAENGRIGDFGKDPSNYYHMEQQLRKHVSSRKGTI